MGGDEGCPERPGYWEVLGHTGRVPGDTGPPGGWCVTLVLGGGVSPQVGGGSTRDVLKTLWEEIREALGDTGTYWEVPGHTGKVPSGV